MTHDEAIRYFEKFVAYLKQERFDKDGWFCPMIGADVPDELEAALSLLRGSGVSSMRKDDQGAALLPADPPASPASSEALPNDDPNRCCGRAFCRTTLDLWREQDRLLNDIVNELGVEQPDQILAALAEQARIEAAAFHAVMQYGVGTEERAREAMQQLEALFQEQDDTRVDSATPSLSEARTGSGQEPCGAIKDPHVEPPPHSQGEIERLQAKLRGCELGRNLSAWYHESVRKEFDLPDPSTNAIVDHLRATITERDEYRAKLQEIISAREAYDAQCVRVFGGCANHAGRTGAELNALIRACDIKLVSHASAVEGGSQ